MLASFFLCLALGAGLHPAGHDAVVKATPAAFLPYAQPQDQQFQPVTCKLYDTIERFLPRPLIIF